VFRWLETHAHDRENGGYYEGFDPEGHILWEPEPNAPRPLDAIGSDYGVKSQNAHLHLMEAFSELARVWRDDLLVERLAELREIMGTKLMSREGGMHAYANPDWTPILSAFSYGHDIEAAHLLLDADLALFGEVRPDTVRWATTLADHTLAEGFDWTEGGFYAEGREGHTSENMKIWWAQAEGLLGLARVLELTGNPRYEDALLLTWRWIRDRQIDSTFGGWFDTILADGSWLYAGRKGSMWKAAYHDGRALISGAQCLRRIASSR
jgi:mannobiose 2-epimerase